MVTRTLLLTMTLGLALLAADAAVTAANKKIAEKKYDEAIADLAKAKPSPEVKKALASAYLGKGDSMMYDDALPPRVKYPGALKAYRQVLVYDAANATAKKNIATIEGIYKSMGRPIPQ